MIAGKYQVKPERPFAPGYEAACFVAALGQGVTGLRTGQRIMAPTGSGAFADLVVVEAARVFPMPDVMPFD
jgi:NADPH2:quinone reductase